MREEGTAQFLLLRYRLAEVLGAAGMTIAEAAARLVKAGATMTRWRRRPLLLAGSLLMRLSMPVAGRVRVWVRPRKDGRFMRRVLRK